MSAIAKTCGNFLFITYYPYTIKKSNIRFNSNRVDRLLPEDGFGLVPTNDDLKLKTSLKSGYHAKAAHVKTVAYTFLDTVQVCYVPLLDVRI
jgi:hypothetical protein